MVWGFEVLDMVFLVVFGLKFVFVILILEFWVGVVLDLFFVVFVGFLGFLFVVVVVGVLILWEIDWEVVCLVGVLFCVVFDFFDVILNFLFLVFIWFVMDMNGDFVVGFEVLVEGFCCVFFGGLFFFLGVFIGVKFFWDWGCDLMGFLFLLNLFKVLVSCVFMLLLLLLLIWIGNVWLCGGFLVGFGCLEGVCLVDFFVGIDLWGFGGWLCFLLVLVIVVYLELGGVGDLVVDLLVLVVLFVIVKIVVDVRLRGFLVVLVGL